MGLKLVCFKLQSRDFVKLNEAANEREVPEQGHDMSANSTPFLARAPPSLLRELPRCGVEFIPEAESARYWASFKEYFFIVSQLKTFNAAAGVRLFRLSS